MGGAALKASPFFLHWDRFERLEFLAFQLLQIIIIERSLIGAKLIVNLLAVALRRRWSSLIPIFTLVDAGH